MKLLSVTLAAAALCWASVSGEPINRAILARQAGTSTAAACPVTKTRKTITWNYYRPAWPRQMPRFTQETELAAPGIGYAWREAYGGDSDPTDHLTRRVLFENDQGWSVVNCTWKYAADDPARKGCTTTDSALLNTPNTKVGDQPSDKGKIGTIKGLGNPGMSPWAIYDIISFRLTPVVDKTFYKEQINIEVHGWRDDGSKTKTMNFKIKGSETGYKVSPPKGDWNKIIQWQVKVWWGSGSTRQEFPFLIDDLIIDEYAVSFTDDDTHCLFPTQTPTTTSPVVTLEFDDITASPTEKPLLSYKSYSFSSDWVVTNSQSYPAKHPGTKSAISKPNALYTQNIPSSENILFADSFLFDIDSFHLTIDNTSTTTQNPADLVVNVWGWTTCFRPYSGVPSLVDGAYFQVNPTTYGFDVDLKAIGFRKQLGVIFSVREAVGVAKVPFWIDNVVVRSWKDGLKPLPGCERCTIRTLTGAPLVDFCEYPRQVRT